MSELADTRLPAKPDGDPDRRGANFASGDWLRLSALAPEPASTFGVDPAAAHLVSPSGESLVDTHPHIAGYEILGVLGLSPTGVVYKVRELTADHVVALKLYRTGGDPADRLARLRFTATIQHPNIIPAYAVDEWNGLPFVTMELVDGETLAHAVARRPQPPEFAAEVVEHLARAVHAAHAAGALHLGLNPACVCLDAVSRPRILDFGVAERTTTAVEATRIGQSPAYLSPEQLAGAADRVGPRSDVYSLGAILYELLTGRPPFQAAVPQSLLDQILTADPLPPSRLQADLRGDLDTVCLKCLRKSPADRYASAAALADDLSRFRTGGRIAARPAGRWRRLFRVSPAQGASVAAALVVCAALAWTAAVRLADGSRPTAPVQKAFDAAQEQYAAARLAADGDLRPWEEASAAARRVTELLKPGDDRFPWGAQVRELAAQVDRDTTAARGRAGALEKDRRLRDRLAEIWLRGGPGQRDPSESLAKQYRAAFHDFGAEPETFSLWADRGPARDELSAAVVEYTFLELLSKEQDVDRRRALEMLSGRESDPWRRRLWAALVQRDAVAAVALTGQWDAQVQPPSVLFVAARLLTATGFPTEAVVVLTAAQRQHPGDFWIAHELAWQLQHLDRQPPDDAVAFYRTAAALRPDLPAVWTHLARALSETGRHDEAEYHHRRVIEKTPDSPLGYCDLGYALLARGKPHDALAEFRKAIDRDPALPAAWHGIGMVYRKLERLDEALNAYRTAAGGPAGVAALAAHCVDQKRYYALATELHAELRRADSGPADVPRTERLFRFAWVAAQAGCGESADGGTLTSAERRRLRQQALDWLSEALNGWEQIVHEKPEKGPAMQAALTAWKTGPMLACVRDAASLARLPDDEQSAWGTFWKRVDATLTAQPR